MKVRCKIYTNIGLKVESSIRGWRENDKKRKRRNKNFSNYNNGVRVRELNRDCTIDEPIVGAINS